MSTISTIEASPSSPKRSEQRRGNLLPLREYKTRARLLLKALRSSEAEARAAAIQKIRILPLFEGMSDEAIVKRGLLKHALHVVAMGAGLPSFDELKWACERSLTAEWEGFYPRPSGGLNHWCRSYEEARGIHQQVGGYLLPYRHQYFVCRPEHIEAIGMDPGDGDWEKLGFDWIEPKDRQAHNRLRHKLESLYKH